MKPVTYTIMKPIIHAIALVLIFTSTAMSKRSEPEKVPPITTNKAVITAPHSSVDKLPQNGGILEAHHPKTKKLLWRIQIYKTDYDEAIEKDIQDVFIKTLSFDKGHNLLLMSDEKGRLFVLNLETKKVTQVE